MLSFHTAHALLSPGRRVPSAGSRCAAEPRAPRRPSPPRLRVPIGRAPAPGHEGATWPGWGDTRRPPGGRADLPGDAPTSRGDMPTSQGDAQTSRGDMLTSQGTRRPPGGRADLPGGRADHPCGSPTEAPAAGARPCSGSSGFHSTAPAAPGSQFWGLGICTRT